MSKNSNEWVTGWTKKEADKLLGEIKVALNKKNIKISRKDKEYAEIMNIEPSIVDKYQYLDSLATLFSSSLLSHNKSPVFDDIINYLIDFSIFSDEPSEDIKAFALGLACSAKNYTDISNIDFHKIINSMDNLSDEVLDSAISILSYTSNLEFEPYIIKYKDHTDPEVRETVKEALENFAFMREKQNKTTNITNQPQSKLIRDIKAMGYSLASIEDLTSLNLDLKSKSLVSLLLWGLKSIEDEQDKAFIVKCLCIKGLTQVSETLLNEFENASTDDYKCTIGNSISIISDISILDKLLEIVINKNHGMARQMIVHGLGDYRSKEVRKILLSLLADEEVLEQAIHALGKMNDRSIIPHIEAFTNHSKENIRSEAIKAVEELKKSPTIQERKIILD